MCMNLEQIAALKAQGFSDEQILNMAALQDAARSFNPTPAVDLTPRPAPVQSAALQCNTFVDPTAASRKSLRSITLTAALDNTNTGVFLDNSLGLFSPLGIVTGTDVEFDVSGPVPVSAVKEMLKSYAIVIKRLNYTSTVSSQLDNNIGLIEAKIDGTQKTTTIDSSIDRLSSDLNPNLLNIKQPFVLTNERGLFIPATGGSQTIQLVLDIAEMVPYGKLAEYLNQNTGVCY